MDRQVEAKELNIREQMVRIDEALESGARHRAEMEQRREETRLANPNSIFQAMIASAALLGAGAVLVKLFFL